MEYGISLISFVIFIRFVVTSINNSQLSQMSLHKLKLKLDIININRNRKWDTDALYNIGKILTKENCSKLIRILIMSEYLSEQISQVKENFIAYLKVGSRTSTLLETGSKEKVTMVIENTR